MAIAEYSWTNKAVQTNVDTVNLSVTTPGGGDVVLVVSVESRENSTPDREVSAISFNTSEGLVTAMVADNGTQVNSEKWYIVNPTATTANVTVTMQGLCQAVYVSACVITGADTISPIDDAYGETGTNDSSTTVGSFAEISYANSISIDGIVIDDDDGHTMNAYSGRVERRDQTDPANSESGASIRTSTTPGDYYMDWTKPATAEDWAWSVVSIKEAATPSRRRIIVT